MPAKPRRSTSCAISRVWRRRPGTETRLMAGRGWGIGVTPVIRFGSASMISVYAEIATDTATLVPFAGNARYVHSAPRPKLIEEWAENLGRSHVATGLRPVRQFRLVDD